MLQRIQKNKKIKMPLKEAELIFKIFWKYVWCNAREALIIKTKLLFFVKPWDCIS